MKKMIFAVLVLVAFGSTSCEYCVRCTFQDPATGAYLDEKESCYNSKDDSDRFREDLEAVGYKCSDQ